jgi:hypothetical protein
MWEQLEDFSRFMNHRLRVPGGWIVRTVVIAFSAHEGGAPAPSCDVEQTFIRDPGHKWALQKKEQITTETIPVSDDKDKVKKLTIANRSTCSPEEIEAIRQIINDVRGT